MNRYEIKTFLAKDQEDGNLLKYEEVFDRICDFETFLEGMIKNAQNVTQINTIEIIKDRLGDILGEETP